MHSVTASLKSNDMKELLNIKGDKTKMVIWSAVGIIVLVFLIYCIVKFTRLGKTVSEKINSAQNEKILANEIDFDSVTNTKAQRETLIAKLKTAFGRYGWGTDEETVYEVFEALDTRSDVLALYKEFGTHEGHTLTEWLNKELSYPERQHVQEILNAKGITFEI